MSQHFVNEFEKKPTVFVIMPYGRRLGRLDTRGNIYDMEGLQNEVDTNFEFVYKELIEPAIPDKFECIRADKILNLGSIESQLIDQLSSASFVIADITFANGNVLYELGIRHMFSRSGTIIITREGTNPPFDISGDRFFSYQYGSGVDRDFIKSIKAILLNPSSEKALTSPVYRSFPDLYLNPIGEKEISRIREEIKITKAREEVLKNYVEQQRLIEELKVVNTTAKAQYFLAQRDKDYFEFEADFQLAVALSRNNLLEEAIEIFEELEKTEPIKTKVLREKGLAYRRMGSNTKDGIAEEKYFSLAMDCFKKAVDQNKYDPELLAIMGGLDKRVDRLKEAYDHYADGYKLAPKDVYVLTGYASIRYLRNMPARSQFIELENICRKNIEGQNPHYWDYFSLGFAELFLGKKNASGMFKMALRQSVPEQDIISVRDELDNWSKVKPLTDEGLKALTFLSSELRDQ
ncbi:MAG TPA: hypothetical protein DCR93_06325 [Cytophagales bacterium]|nr:hypothetical protein [Cytophagales bacterium]HAP59126.1 hypothetical protein [Cytophagales bacterium]